MFCVFWWITLTAFLFNSFNLITNKVSKDFISNHKPSYLKSLTLSTVRDAGLSFLFLICPIDDHWALRIEVLFSFTGAYGPEHWVTASLSCGGHHQSPIDILDQHARVGEEYQELQLDGFDNESSNKTWMKNTGKTGRACLDLSTNNMKYCWMSP